MKTEAEKDFVALETAAKESQKFYEVGNILKIADDIYEVNATDISDLDYILRMDEKRNYLSDFYPRINPQMFTISAKIKQLYKNHLDLGAMEGTIRLKGNTLFLVVREPKTLEMIIEDAEILGYIGNAYDNDKPGLGTFCSIIGLASNKIAEFSWQHNRTRAYHFAKDLFGEELTGKYIHLSLISWLIPAEQEEYQRMMKCFPPEVRKTLKSIQW